MAMTACNPEALPPAGTVWKWYSERRDLKLTPQQRAHVAAYCLLRGVPTFYWLSGCAEDEIKDALRGVVKRRSDPDSVANALAVAAFLGKRFHGSLVSHLGEYADRVGKPREFPELGPRYYFEGLFIPRRGRGGKPTREELEAELDDIAKSALNYFDNEPARQDSRQAQRLDSILYARDSYASRPEQQKESEPEKAVAPVAAKQSEPHKAAAPVAAERPEM